MTLGLSTIFLPSDPDELCDRLKLLLEEIVVNEEIVVRLDKLLEYKCMSERQHKQILNKCNLSHTKKK